MKDKKLQIFVSSTYTDLIQERQSAVEAILSSGNIPAGMELFSAGDQSQMSVIERWIDESDVYLLILGGRYGSVHKESGKSYTHLEFEYAVKNKKPLFAIVISEKALEIKVQKEGIKVIEQDNNQAFKEFKTTVLEYLVKFWDDCKDIKIAIHETISDFNYRKDLVGWIRGDNSVNTGFLAEEIARLTKENSELRNKLMESSLASTTSTLLYAGLSYTHMKELLENETFQDAKTKESINLYNFLMDNGDDISTKAYAQGSQEKYGKLIMYKLVIKVHNLSSTGLPFTRTYYEFTEDGQHFYLKSLSLKMQQNSLLNDVQS